MLVTLVFVCGTYAKAAKDEPMCGATDGYSLRMTNRDPALGKSRARATQANKSAKVSRQRGIFASEPL